MDMVGSIDSSLGYSFVTGAFWEVIGAFEFGVKYIWFMALCTPVVIDKKRTLILGEFQGVVFKLLGEGTFEGGWVLQMRKYCIYEMDQREYGCNKIHFT